MENQKITTVKTALNFGIILGGLSIVYSLMLFFLDMHYQGDSTTSVIGYLIFIIIVFWAIKDFKKNNNGYISLSEGLKNRGRYFTYFSSNTLHLYYNSDPISRS